MSGLLLDHARLLLGHDGPGPLGTWPRAAAVVARRALEESLDRFWRREYEGVDRASRATQVACLGHFVKDRTLADDVRVAWYGLSRACHHHAYELAPTVSELENWIEQVGRLVERMEAEG